MARLSMRDAINAMCKGCIYDEIVPGTWREQVTACTSPNCPLFELRPLCGQVADGLWTRAELVADLDRRQANKERGFALPEEGGSTAAGTPSLPPEGSGQLSPPDAH